MCNVWPLYQYSLKKRTTHQHTTYQHYSNHTRSINTLSVTLQRSIWWMKQLHPINTQLYNIILTLVLYTLYWYPIAAIDLVDEAAAKLKIEVTSKPQVYFLAAAATTTPSITPCVHPYIHQISPLPLTNFTTLLVVFVAITTPNTPFAHPPPEPVHYPLLTPRPLLTSTIFY